jgi:hypothetical protein
MSEATRTAKVATTAPANRSGDLLLQRKCPCGGKPGLDGECADCRKRRLAGSPGLAVQTKLVIGACDDPFEREAERVARAVSSLPSGASASPRPCRAGARSPAVGHEEEEIEKEITELDEVVSPAPLDGLDESLRSLRGNGRGRPLESGAKHLFEPLFNYDFGRVRVHKDRQADQLSRALGSRAFTVGTEVVFAAGEYAPGSNRGRRLLAHELTHVVQQSSGPLRRSPLTRDGNRHADPFRVSSASIRLQRCSTDGKPPVSANTVVCNGKGGFRVRVTGFGGAAGEKCGLKDCMTRHENRHITDFWAWCPDICKDKADGARTLMTTDERKKSEVTASNVEIACLQGYLAMHGDSKDAACTTMVENRIKRMEAYRDSFK